MSTVSTGLTPSQLQESDFWADGTFKQPEDREPSVTAGPLGGLTPRQLRVLDLVSLGQSQRQIARRLGMSETNVNVDLRRARIKLGAITTAHAVRIVVEMGILGSDREEVSS